MTQSLTHLEPAPTPSVPVSGMPDLWCTYAAVRTLAWLGRADRAPNHRSTADYVLGRRNNDGGFAWSKGMPSDAWATFYCTATLADLGRPVPSPERTARWLRGTWSGEAYAMMPGQAPDVWATHFSTRTAVEVCGEDVPDRTRLLAWLGALQTAEGGLSWSPAHARVGDADVRACYYGVAAWRALHSREAAEPPWDVAALTAWLRRQQTGSGGFTFGPEAEVPCMWATYRAVGALAALGAAPAADCAEWILDRRDPRGAFTRWPDYPVADVWASFCAVGALRESVGITPDVADAVEQRLTELACADGGFSYREPELAADALHTAAAALLAADDDPALPVLRSWLEGCRLPNEGGVMYMPGRGAEVRCTMWALAAGAFRDDPRALRGIGAWLVGLQNPDGGFGYWHGRGSDLVSTAAAAEIWRVVGPHTPARLRLDGMAGFVERCARTGDPDGAGFGNVPGAPATLRSGLHAARILGLLGRQDPQGVADLLDRHRVRGGGWANQGRRMPDLATGYEAVVTADRFRLTVEHAHLGAFLDRTESAAGVSWSPLAPATDDPLAVCQHRLLRRRLDHPQLELPALSLT